MSVPNVMEETFGLRNLTAASLRNWPLPRLEGKADKEDRGHILIVAGSREIPGAALLCATAALRVGAGKLTIATGESVAIGLALAIPEARVIALPETAEGDLKPAGVRLMEKCIQQCSGVLVGPGLTDAAGRAEFASALLLAHPSIPFLLDAAAMDVVLQGGRFTQPILLSPHAGEMAHITGQPKATVLGDPVAAARELALKVNATVVLKGAKTAVANAHSGPWLHQAAVPGLATSGSGDVLAGIIAGLFVRGAALDQAAAWGTVLHAQAGEELSKTRGTVGYLARELIDELPRLLERLSSDRPQQSGA